MISSSDAPLHSVFKLPMMSSSISAGELTGRSTSFKLGGETVPRPGIGRGDRDTKKGWLTMSGICYVSFVLCLSQEDVGRLTVIRLSGSFSSIRVNRSRAGPLISSGISKTPILTFCKSDRMLSSSKGRRPVSRAKRMIPHDQISDEDPWYALPCGIKSARACHYTPHQNIPQRSRARRSGDYHSSSRASARQLPKRPYRSRRP